MSEDPTEARIRALEESMAEARTNQKWVNAATAENLYGLSRRVAETRARVNRAYVAGGVAAYFLYATLNGNK